MKSISQTHQARLFKTVSEISILTVRSFNISNEQQNTLSRFCPNDMLLKLAQFYKAFRKASPRTTQLIEKLFYCLDQTYNPTTKTDQLLFVPVNTHSPTPSTQPAIPNLYSTPLFLEPSFTIHRQRMPT